jgi:hypothetical protein
MGRDIAYDWLCHIVNEAHFDTPAKNNKQLTLGYQTASKCTYFDRQSDPEST